METQISHVNHVDAFSSFSEFGAFILALFIVYYYAYLIGLLFDGNKSITKKEFMIGLIPISLFIAMIYEAYNELD